MNRCLYYPDLEPNHRWLRQVLLLVDEVYRIIPTDIINDDSQPLRDLLQAEPNVLKDFRPTKSDINLPQPLLDNLAIVLDDIKATLPPTILNPKRILFKDNSIVGWNFLHSDKVSATLMEMLQQRNFIHKLATDIKEELSGEKGWLAVPAGVDDLIVSVVADRIAEANGYDALTDKPLAFALNAVSACEGYGDALRDGIVSNAVTSYQVPSAIELLSLDDYLELRTAFAPAREEFALMVRQISLEYRLDRITDPIAFRKRFDELCQSIGANIEKARASRISKSIKDWVPMTVSTLIAIAKALGIAHFPEIMTPFLEFGATAIPIAPSKEGSIRYPKVYRHLAEAQSKCAAAEIASLTKR